jgi:hypothetical protein
MSFFSKLRKFLALKKRKHDPTSRAEKRAKLQAIYDSAIASVKAVYEDCEAMRRDPKYTWTLVDLSNYHANLNAIVQSYDNSCATVSNSTA